MSSRESLFVDVRIQAVKLIRPLLFVLTSVALIHGQAVRRVSLLIDGGIVVSIDETHHVYNPGAVAVDGAEIVAVGAATEIRQRFRAADRIDATGDVVLPGLINTHTHAPMVLYRGLADDLPLQEWLEKYIFPAEAKTVSREMVRIGTRLAAAEMIQSGTTTFVDMYYFEEEIARVAKAAGLRGVLGQTIIKFPVADAKTPAEGLARTEAFIKEFQHDDLITPAVAPHAPYTNDASTLRDARALATKYGMPLISHVSETSSEVKESQTAHAGMSPVAYLDSIQFFGPRTLLAHAVWTSADDIAILKRHAVGVSHNPESNMKLASGIAPVPAYLAAGIAVGLGTDGAASNNDLDMFEAMRQASFLAKHAEHDPTVVPAQTALDMATIGGARALGMAEAIGSLEAGKRADLIAVSVGAPRQTPLYEPISHLVYTTRGDDVRTTIVNGRVLMKDRQVRTLDRAAVIADATRLAARVRAAVGR